MDKRDTSVAPPRLADARGSFEDAVQQSLSRRLKFWAFAAGLPLLGLVTLITLLAVVQFRQLAQVRRELEMLKAESVRFGQGVEIYNPAWGTVIDGVDPQRFPSRDARDPRYGAGVQQYLPRGNQAQVWNLRPPSPATGQFTPLPLAAYVRHGHSFLRARDYARAVQAFQFCLEHYPDAAEAHNGLAAAFRDQGNFPLALASHDRAMELETNRVEFRWERSVTHLRAGDPGSAITDCLGVLAQNPDFADAHNTLGIIYRDRQNHADALKHHDRAIALSPQREDFWRERSVTHRAKGDAAAAAADAARAGELQQMRR